MEYRGARMTELDIGDLIEFRGSTWQIRRFDGPVLELRCLDDGSTVPVGVVLADNTFVGPAQNGPSVAEQRLLDLAPPQRRREAEFWYEHMYEVKYGIAWRDRGILAPTAPTTTVAARLVAKRAELMSAGVAVSMATMWRKWRGFTQHGVIGCADHRGMPGHVRLSQIDQQVAPALQAVKAQFTDRSTPTKKQIIEMAKHQLTENNIRVPGRTSMYELLEGSTGASTPPARRPPAAATPTAPTGRSARWWRYSPAKRCNWTPLPWTPWC